MERLPYEFYHRPCLEVAKDLVGKVLVHNGQRLRISETESNRFTAFLQPISRAHIVTRVVKSTKRKNLWQKVSFF